MSGEFPEKPEDVRVDRDTTRAELTETLEALAHKLDVKTRVHDAVDDKLNHAEMAAADVVGAPTAVRLRQGAEIVRSNPLPVFASVLGLIIVIRLLMRRRSA